MENQKTLIKRLQSVKTNESLSQTLDQLHDICTRTTGFTFCYSLLFNTTSMDNPTLYLYNRLPEAWQVNYAERDYHIIDPSWEHAKHHLTPLYWSSLDEIKLSKAQKLMMEDANRHGLCSGVLIPFQGRSGYSLTWIMSSEKETEVRTNLEWIQAYVWEIIPYLFEATARVVKHGSRSPLTKREVECLYQAAEGTSTYAIAEALCLAPVTVDKHIKSTIDKLQAKNRTHAVRIARDLGLLTAREISFNFIKEVTP